MNFFKNIVTDDKIENETDRIGGGAVVLNSGLYELEIALAYVHTASSGAMAMVLGFKTEDNKDLKQTIYFTSSTAKGGKNTYVDNDGKTQYLPGYQLVNSLCLLTVGKELKDLEPETKVVKVYNPETKKEEPANVPMLMELIGQKVLAGVIKQVVDKTKKEGTEYVATGETREENDISKFFRLRDRMTTTEIRARAEKAAFVDTWAEKFTGQVIVKAKGKAAAGTAGAPKPSAAGAPKATGAKSLFA